MGRNRVSDTKTKNNRKSKIHLVFDADARRKFLSGFHARKLQRKKKAKEDVERQIKEEKKRLRTEARKKYKELVNVQDPAYKPEELYSEELQLENHFVSICELSTAEISLKNKWIGINQVKNDTSEETCTEKPDEKAAKKFQTKKDLKKALKKQADSKVKKTVHNKGKQQHRGNRKKRTHKRQNVK